MMTKEEMTLAADHLVEIKEKMINLIDEARQVVEGTPAEARANAYWLAHLRCALDDDHGYLGGSMCTLQDSINELREDEEDE